MKKRSFLTFIIAIAVTMATFAQTSTPEVPRNYKPQPKELLPMPDSMTENEIFPVLGTFDLTDTKGTASHVTITRDGENKGIVWVSGLPQGKFKALIKDAPATYKIPAQKALANDDAMEAAEDDATATKTKSKVVSGRSIQEGTLIFDKDANTLYVNIGNKYNEEQPTAAFPEMNATEENTAPEVEMTDDTAKKAKKTSTKKPVIKGITYTGAKTDVPAAAPEASPEAAPSQN
ncbi:hypothetical protein [Niabella drilacis]|uniref:DUF5666 domain-containing protein n=1 Tax=Niabella drilacis (strain DSM 25811 / CCM 8410 / CCUG 62505 / LMG 26954 / E90) TaxID=1285928 RepID=A0A1G6IV63_NIADE|nr:hypothetical protein [Niabella drilacis]SDC09905.1 hypothetical protein SAMN04487894_101326 [Niabella drilacis]